MKKTQFRNSEGQEIFVNSPQSDQLEATAASVDDQTHATVNAAKPKRTSKKKGSSFNPFTACLHSKEKDDKQEASAATATIPATIAAPVELHSVVVETVTQAIPEESPSSIVIPVIASLTRAHDVFSLLNDQVKIEQVSLAVPGLIVTSDEQKFLKTLGIKSANDLAALTISEEEFKKSDGKIGREALTELKLQANIQAATNMPPIFIAALYYGITGYRVTTINQLILLSQQRLVDFIKKNFNEQKALTNGKEPAQVIADILTQAQIGNGITRDNYQAFLNTAATAWKTSAITTLYANQKNILSKKKPAGAAQTLAGSSLSAAESASANSGIVAKASNSSKIKNIASKVVCDCSCAWDDSRFSEKAYLYGHLLPLVDENLLDQLGIDQTVIDDGRSPVVLPDWYVQEIARANAAAALSGQIPATSPTNNQPPTISPPTDAEQKRRYFTGYNSYFDMTNIQFIFVKIQSGLRSKGITFLDYDPWLAQALHAAFPENYYVSDFLAGTALATESLAMQAAHISTLHTVLSERLAESILQVKVPDTSAQSGTVWVHAYDPNMQDSNKATKDGFNGLENAQKIDLLIQYETTVIDGPAKQGTSSRSVPIWLKRILWQQLIFALTNLLQAYSLAQQSLVQGLRDDAWDLANNQQALSITNNLGDTIRGAYEVIVTSPLKLLDTVDDQIFSDDSRSTDGFLGKDFSVKSTTAIEDLYENLYGASPTITYSDYVKKINSNKKNIDYHTLFDKIKAIIFSFFPFEKNQVNLLPDDDLVNVEFYYENEQSLLTPSPNTAASTVHKGAAGSFATGTRQGAAAIPTVTVSPSAATKSPGSQSIKKMATFNNLKSIIDFVEPSSSRMADVFQSVFTNDPADISGAGFGSSMNVNTTQDPTSAYTLLLFSKASKSAIFSDPTLLDYFWKFSDPTPNSDQKGVWKSIDDNVNPLLVLFTPAFNLKILVNTLATSLFFMPYFKHYILPFLYANAAKATGNYQSALNWLSLLLDFRNLNSIDFIAPFEIFEKEMNALIILLGEIYLDYAEALYRKNTYESVQHAYDLYNNVLTLFQSYDCDQKTASTKLSLLGVKSISSKLKELNLLTKLNINNFTQIINMGTRLSRDQQALEHLGQGLEKIAQQKELSTEDTNLQVRSLILSTESIMAQFLQRQIHAEELAFALPVSKDLTNAAAKEMQDDLNKNIQKKANTSVVFSAPNVARVAANALERITTAVEEITAAASQASKTVITTSNVPERSAAIVRTAVVAPPAAAVETAGLLKQSAVVASEANVKNRLIAENKLSAKFRIPVVSLPSTPAQWYQQYKYDALCQPPNPKILLLLKQAKKYKTQIDYSLNFFSLSALGSGVMNQYQYERLLQQARYYAGLAKQLVSSYLQYLKSYEDEEDKLLQILTDNQIQSINLAIKDLQYSQASLAYQTADLNLQATEEQVSFYQDELANHTDIDWSKAITGAISQTISLGSAAIKWGTAEKASEQTEGGIGTIGVLLQIGINFASAYLAEQQRVEVQKRLLTYQEGQAIYAHEIAGKNKEIAAINVSIASQQQEIASIQSSIGLFLLQIIQTQTLNPTTYRVLYQQARQLAIGYLDIATYWAYLMENNIRLLSPNMAVTQPAPIIRFDYHLNPVADPTRGILGAADNLLEAIEQLDYSKSTHVMQRTRVTKQFSLWNEQLLGFFQFRTSGKIFFRTTADYIKTFEGTVSNITTQQPEGYYGHYYIPDYWGLLDQRIESIELRLLGLLSSTNSFQLTLTNSGISWVMATQADQSNSNQATNPINFILRRLINSSQTIAFSYPMGQSTQTLYSAERKLGQLIPFEGLGLETDWKVILDPVSNQVDLNNILDLQLLITYSAIYSLDYEKRQRAMLKGYQYNRSRVFGLQRDFAEAFYQLNHGSSMYGFRDLRIISFDTTESLFGPNEVNQRINALSLYLYELPKNPQANLANPQPKQMSLSLSISNLTGPKFFKQAKPALQPIKDMPALTYADASLPDASGALVAKPLFGCYLFLMSSLPSVLDSYIGNYILLKKTSLVFIDESGKEVAIDITDMAKFCSSIDEIVDGKPSLFLSNAKIRSLITSNGGHSPILPQKEEESDNVKKHWVIKIDADQNSFWYRRSLTGRVQNTREQKLSGINPNQMTEILDLDSLTSPITRQAIVQSDHLKRFRSYQLQVKCRLQAGATTINWLLDEAQKSYLSFSLSLTEAAKFSVIDPTSTAVPGKVPFPNVILATNEWYLLTFKTIFENDRCRLQIQVDSHLIFDTVFDKLTLSGSQVCFATSPQSHAQFDDLWICRLNSLGQQQENLLVDTFDGTQKDKWTYLEDGAKQDITKVLMQDTNPSMDTSSIQELAIQLDYNYEPSLSLQKI